MPDAVLSPRQRHTWRERANGKICIEMLAERTATGSFPPRAASVGRTQQRGETRAAIWQACREFGRNSIFNMRRRQATSNLQLESAAFCKNRNSKGVGRPSVAESLPLCMRCGPLALLVIQIGEGISSGAILAHSAIGDSESVCPIHRAISILFEDDAVLFETWTTTAAADGGVVRPSVHSVL